MSGNNFQFKQFSISQEHSALKVGTDAVILGALVDFDKPLSILDIGTGTGILALMMAQKYSSVITAIDIDEGACADATLNVSKSPWNDRIMVEQTSVQNFTEHCNVHFDGIVCNPPFFSKSLKNATTNRTIARHTDMLSPKDLFFSISLLLNEKGKTYIIIPESERILFCENAAEYNLYLTSEIEVFPYVLNSKANRVVLSFEKEWKSFTKQNIHIRNNGMSYSQEFVDLTKDFYLKI